MEAFAILGLAGNIVQFLDFSGSLISGTIELYQTVNGATSSHTVLENTTEDLGRLCSGLLRTTHRTGGLPPLESEAAVESLSRSCENLGQELLAVLKDLKVKARRKGWQSARQALRSALKAKELERYENKLSLYRSQIAIHLLDILGQRQDQANKLHSRMSADLLRVSDIINCLNNDHMRLEIGEKNQVAELQYAIISSLKHHPHSEALEGATDNATGQLSKNLPRWLSGTISASAALAKQVSIIDSLQFPSIFQREENIKEAHPATFEWLFETPNETTDLGQQRLFLEWLREGSGTYWASGKAGSGKSTLMKFVSRNDKTIAALNHWAGTRRLVIARYFFWNAGTTMQKSQLGLLQTLLFHIFRQSPSLIASLCPERWSQSLKSTHPWSHSEISRIFSRLEKEVQGDAQFCFFIDGLDEFDGDHLDIINVINTLASSPIVKICFSSRPWNVFQMSYGDNNGNKLRLQDLTRGDITRFAHDRLADGTLFHSLRATDNAYESLVQEIVDRSDGVFLWVFLVVNSLRRGMTNFDTVSELKRRLRELPVELEKFFQHILDSTERVYHEQAARLYLIRLVARGPLRIVDIHMFADTNLDFALEHEGVLTRHDATTTPAITSSIATTKARVMARCQDLLEFDKDDQLQFLHRTVKDFLETGNIRKLMEERAGFAFNPHHFMCNSLLCRLREREPTLWGTPASSLKLEEFWYHSRSMEVEGKLNYRLFPMFERIAWIQLQRSGPNVRIINGELYYRGWLPTMALENGVKGYLTYHIKRGVEMVSDRGRSVRRCSLDVALRYVISNQRPDSVRRLLKEGADPNEICHYLRTENTLGQTVWRAYISGLRKRNRFSLMFIWDEVDIIEMLLLNGADPSIGDKEQHSFRHYLVTAGVPTSATNRLEELRTSLRDAQMERQKMVCSPEESRLPIRRHDWKGRTLQHNRSEKQR